MDGVRAVAREPNFYREVVAADRGKDGELTEVGEVRGGDDDVGGGAREWTSVSRELVKGGGGMGGEAMTLAGGAAVDIDVGGNDIAAEGVVNVLKEVEGDGLMGTDVDGGEGDVTVTEVDSSDEMFRNV